MMKPSYILGKVPTKVIRLPEEERQKNRVVAGILKDMVLESRESRVVQQFSRKILQDRGVRPKDYLGEIRALYEFVRDEIPYRRDAAFLDTFVTAERQIQDYLFGSPSGDCDDKAILLASLLLSVGHVPRFVLTNSYLGAKYSHIFVEVLFQGKWICLETTESVEMGFCPPSFKRGLITLINPKEMG